MRFLKPKAAATALSTAAVLLAGPLSASADDAPKVVASFSPIHSLVASVMEGVAEPTLLVPPTASPHDFALRPSEAQSLDEADIIVRIGPELEAFLDKPIASLGANARILDLMEAEGVEHLPTRKAGVFEQEVLGGEAAGHSNEHAHKEEDAHEGEHAGTESAHDHDNNGHEAGEGHAHHHGPEDPHVWLDPANAKALVAAIAKALSDTDPQHADIYRQNAQSTADDIDAMAEEVRSTLEPVKDRPLVAFHDALQYFEKAFGLQIAGTLTISPEIAPGARRLAALREAMEKHDVTCILVEPQFSPRLAETLAAETGARIAEFSPEGSAGEPGPGAYAETMLANAANIADCLGQQTEN